MCPGPFSRSLTGAFLVSIGFLTGKLHLFRRSLFFPVSSKKSANNRISLQENNLLTEMPSLGDGALPAKVDTYSSGSSADSHEFGASVNPDRNGDGTDDATLSMRRRLSAPSDQLFDWGLTSSAPGG
jgi:hypothetical protein